jgi:hypothetical protein
LSIRVSGFFISEVTIWGQGDSRIVIFSYHSTNPWNLPDTEKFKVGLRFVC